MLIHQNWLKLESLKLDVLTDFSRLSNLVDTDVVKKSGWDKLVTKVNAIDTSGLKT